MNRLFLSTTVIFIIVSNVLLCSIKDAEAKEAVKRKIHVEGYGVPASSSKDVPIDVRKQEAFVAAFFEGVRNIAEQVFKKAQYPTISISGQAFPIGKMGK